MASQKFTEFYPFTSDHGSNRGSKRSTKRMTAKSEFESDLAKLPANVTFQEAEESQ